jgi:hypothetical protein
MGSCFSRTTTLDVDLSFDRASFSCDSPDIYRQMSFDEPIPIGADTDSSDYEDNL